MGTQSGTPAGLTDVARLAEILKAAQHNRRVARLIGEVRYDGEARRVCMPDGGTALGNGTDMRDLCLEVTLDGLGTTWWRVADLMTDLESGRVVLDARKG